MNKRDKTITFKGKGNLFIPRNVIRSEYPEVKNNNGGGGGNNENYTWYDFFRDNSIKVFDDYFEQMGIEDINPIPVAIANIYSDNLNFRLLKDIPISQSIANDGFLFYDTTPRLGNNYSTYTGSPVAVRSHQNGLVFENASQYYSIIQIEIDGKTYYSAEDPGD